MIPILFSPAETAFTSNGLGPLTDAVSCIVHEELNGGYELTLSLPTASRHFAEVVERALILAKPNPFDKPQPFRIYRSSKPTNKLVSFYARHISYDLDGYPVWPFTADGAADAVQKINAGKTLLNNPFTVYTELTAAGQLVNAVPTVERALLGGGKNSLLSLYGGEFIYDRFDIYQTASRGGNHGFVIAYGKNLIDVRQERNIGEVYTSVLPYYVENGTRLSGYLQPVPGNWDYTRVLPVDLSGDFSEKPTLDALNAAGAEYVKRENIGVPKVSISAKYVPPGSRGLSKLDDLRLGDAVTVSFETLGIDVQSRMIAYDWDVLLEHYDSVEIGEKRETAAAAISNASRLVTGTIPSSRFGVGSIGSRALQNKAVGAEQLADNSVTVNKIVDGSVIATKIKDGSITGDKVLDQAIAFSKLSGELQVTWTNILAANAVFAGVISADKSVSCSTIIVNGQQYLPGSWSFIDGNGNTRTFYGLKLVTGE